MIEEELLIKNENMNDFCLLSGEQNNNELICKQCDNLFMICALCEGYFDKYLIQSHQIECQKLFNNLAEYDSLLECKKCFCVIKNDEYSNHINKCITKAESHKTKCIHCNELIYDHLIVSHNKYCENMLSEMLMGKEMIQCALCEEQFPLSQIEFHEQKCQRLKEKQEELKNQCSLLKVEFPMEWDRQIYDIKYIDDNLSIITLDKNGQEFNFAQSLLHKSVPQSQVLNVYRIQNLYLWEKYQKEIQKVKYEKGSAEENWLFHGSRANNPKNLYVNGFDISFASDGGSFGRGIYFARQAVYSYSGYCFSANGKGYIFLAKVLTGKYFCPSSHNLKKNKGKARKNASLLRNNVFGGRMNKPPLYDEEKFIYYDSVTDVDNINNSHTSQMFIIYENDKAYPYYLIEFDASQQINNIPSLFGSINNINNISNVKVEVI